MFDCSFWCHNSMALPPNERVWMPAMYWLMWLLITSAAEVAWPWLGCSCSGSLAARSGKSFNAVVDVLVLLLVVDCSVCWLYVIQHGFVIAFGAWQLSKWHSNSSNAGIWRMIASYSYSATCLSRQQMTQEACTTHSTFTTHLQAKSQLSAQ